MSQDISHIPVGKERQPIVLQDPFWERQKGESAKAFEAFVLYRDAGASRSTAKVARELGKSKTLIDRWSGLWKWVPRVQAYDNHVDRERMVTAQQLRRDAIERHINLGQSMQHVGAAYIKDWLEKIERGDLPALTAKDVKELVDVGVKIERLGIGEPTEHTLTDTPEMATERRLRDAVATVRASMREDPDVPQEVLVEWAVAEFNVDMDALMAGLSSEVQVSNVDNH